MGGEISNLQALVRNAQHNARFAWVRLPVIAIVAGFVWRLCGAEIALTWLSVMLLTERISAYCRTRLSLGDAKFAYPHLISLAVMSGLWVCFGVLVWSSDTELGRIAACIGLLTTALYGALSGQKDPRPATILAAPALIALFVLVSHHAWTTWAPVEALVSSLATFGAGASIFFCTRALNLADAAHERAMQQLQRNALLLEETSSVAEVGGWRYDLKAGTLEWTEQALRILGVNHGQAFCANDAFALLTPASQQIVLTAIAEPATPPEGWDVELEITTPAGARKWLRATAKTTGQDERAEALIGSVADITRRKQLETDLHHAQKLESIGRLTGGLAHDFNNILTAIVNATDSLERSNEKRVLEAAHVINKASERASELTGKLLAFSRQQVLHPVTIDINAALSDMRSLISSALRRGVVLELDLAPAPLLTTLDSGQLTNAVLNLALNASDAMPDGGRIILSTRGEGDWVVLDVADTGIGMSTTHVARIFEPFFTTKPAGVGTGLGLAMVHGFITQSGGAVSVTSAPNKGSVFSLRFPRAPADAALAAVQTQPSFEDQSGAGGRVLLVDDDNLVREALTVALRARGFDVVAAQSGAEALSLFKPGAHDFAVVDVVLGQGLSGGDLIEQLRARDGALRALLVSGYTFNCDLPQGVDFLAKPFSVDALAARLHAMARGQPEKNSATN